MMDQATNKRQVGGDHYGLREFQHWDWVELNKIPYLEAVAAKYILRWKDKNGTMDLEKAIHYIEKIKEELEQRGRLNTSLKITNSRTDELCTNHVCGLNERLIIFGLLKWRYVSELIMFIEMLQQIIQEAKLEV